MKPTQQQAFNTAIRAAHATHRYWLANAAICEEIFNEDVQGIKTARKVNHNITAYAEQSKELSALAVELADALTHEG